MVPLQLDCQGWFVHAFDHIYKYLCTFVKTWLKFQVHFNYLTSKWNGKQLKVAS